jgi:chromosome segregation ATPase
LKNKNSEEKPSDKEAKIKAIDDVLKPQADKLAKIKAAVSKIEDPKRKEQASVNVEKLEKAIAELKKRKEALGESFSSFENEVWAIDVLIEALSSEIDNYLIYG